MCAAQRDAHQPLPATAQRGSSCLPHPIVQRTSTTREIRTPGPPLSTQFESFCGSDKSNFKPDPSIDPRTESYLNTTERLQTPYTWYTSSDCRQYVKDFITTIVSR